MKKKKKKKKTDIGMMKKSYEGVCLTFLKMGNNDWVGALIVTLGER